MPDRVCEVTSEVVKVEVVTGALREKAALKGLVLMA